VSERIDMKLPHALFGSAASGEGVMTTTKTTEFWNCGGDESIQ